MGYLKILPVYGEGDRKAVEGGSHSRCAMRPAPSDSCLRACHLPMNGEDQ